MKPLQRTIEALSRSHNEAAAPTLMAGLVAGSGPVFDGAITGLVSRRSKAGHLEVLRLWDRLMPEQKALVEKGRHKMGGALREALLEGEYQLFYNALNFVESSGDFDLIPTLVMVAEQPDGERSHAAIELTAKLVDQLLHWIDNNREPIIGRDPATIRYCVLESLERSVERFREHRRPELLESFIVLAGPHSGTLHNVLETLHHPCHGSIVHTLTHSASDRVLRLLTAMLEGKEAPQVIRNVISKRSDRPFVEALLAVSLDPANAPLRRNLARLRSIACCEDPQTLCVQYSPYQQAAAMHLLAASGASDEQKLALAEALLKHGSVDSRIAACESLRSIGGQWANRLVLLALGDADAAVKATAISQLRHRRIPGTMAKLMELVDSPEEMVSSAAREALSEFSFENFQSRFDLLDDEARREMGTRVAKVDLTARARLKQELASPARRSRLRALQMAAAMDMFPQLADALVERLEDEDHLVRAAAAEALKHCKPSDVRSGLLAAMEDKSVAVQNAAKSSLAALGLDSTSRSTTTPMVAEARS
ncbi:MAG TPA: HEAT repeat domain-containing protein [Lacipirellula sp.]